MEVLNDDQLGAVSGGQAAVSAVLIFILSSFEHVVDVVTGMVDGARDAANNRAYDPDSVYTAH